MNWDISEKEKVCSDYSSTDLIAVLKIGFKSFSLCLAINISVWGGKSHIRLFLDVSYIKWKIVLSIKHGNISP